MLPVDVIHHIHIQSCIERKRGSLLLVPGHTLVDQLLDGIPVGDKEAVESPRSL